MTEQGPFRDKEELIIAGLRYYHDQSHVLSGPMEAATQLWKQLQRRIPARIRDQMALAEFAHELSRRATNGTGADKGWPAAHGMVTVSYSVPDDPASQGRPVQVHIEQLAYDGPSVIVPRILTQTLYATATVVKPLLLFAVSDFHFVIEAFENQRDGLERRIDAMQVGISLLERHNVATVSELPGASLLEFANTWEEAIQTPKEEASAT